MVSRQNRDAQKQNRPHIVISKGKLYRPAGRWQAKTARPSGASIYATKQALNVAAAYEVSSEPKVFVPKHRSAKFRADMQTVRTRLSHIVQPEEAKRWLHTRHEVLGNLRPVDLIANGKTARVLEAITRVEEGIHV